MLQQVEYDPGKLVKWLSTAPNIFGVARRGKLVLTKASRLLLVSLYISQVILIGFAIALFVSDLVVPAAIIFLLTPSILILELVVISFVGSAILNLKRASLMRSAEQIFANHPGQRIAIIGSYGKTSMKELLSTVLGAKLKVAMTPGNKNVAISHARWSKTLSGDEDILIIEYGEGEPGDIAKLASLSHPTHSVVTGLAPNHLDQYKTLEALVSDLADITNFVPEDKIWVHNDGTELTNYFPKIRTYDHTGVDGWQTNHDNILSSGSKFELKKAQKTIKIETGLLGRHNFGALSLVAILALEFGMTVDEIEAAMKLTKPFEHRMQPYILNGACIIDDTYNGNLEGFRAGLNLLSELPAKRKIYVTPGLVDQGEETERVHLEIGQAIAGAKPDKVVLMKNSVTEIIRSSLEKAGYHGQIEIVDSPLEYYENLDKFVAVGDLVMLQNDWTDNYQ